MDGEPSKHSTGTEIPVSEEPESFAETSSVSIAELSVSDQNGLAVEITEDEGPVAEIIIDTLDTHSTPKVKNTFHAAVKVDPRPELLRRINDTSAKTPWNTEIWLHLIQEAANMNDPPFMRETFAKFLVHYPTNVRVWVQWIKFELKSRAYDQMEQIFNKCLRTVPCVELCQLYMEYIHHQHSPLNLDVDESLIAKNTILQAFEFVLTTVGTDKESGKLWMSYITFVKAEEVVSSYEEQHKMDQLRKIFHRAIQTPLHNIETIWKDYDAYENSLSKLTAKKFIADRAGSYMTARSSMKDYKSLMEPIEAISSSWFSVPPTWTFPEVTLLNNWKQYIAWEKSNPLQLDDKQKLVNRVSFAYKSAIIHLNYFPEVWYDYARYLHEMEKPEEAISLLKMAMDSLPNCLLISITLAEFEEARKADFEVIQSIFDTLIARLETFRQTTESQFNEQAADLMKLLADTSKSGQEDENETEWDGERRERERELQKEHQKEVHDRVEVVREKKLLEICSSISLSWIIYMRFTRRCQNIKAARQVFSKSRKSPSITSHAYTASALMEYYVNKDPIVAGKIFELGIKTFNISEDPHATSFVVQYIDFLICLNDDNNTRALFERALAAIPTEKSLPIWTKYLAYETQYGDLSNLQKLQARRSIAFPLDNTDLLESVMNLADKWTIYQLTFIRDCELGVQYLQEAGGHSSVNSQIKFGAGNVAAAKSDDRRALGVLGGIHADQFPRPDLTRWQLYRPEPGQAKGIIQGNRPAFQESVVEAIMLPESIAALLGLLPRGKYEGPFININELMQVICQLQIPALEEAPRMVSFQLTEPKVQIQMQKRVGNWDDDARQNKQFRGQ